MEAPLGRALVGIVDPPRPEVGEAIRRCRQAGIRVVMATGDHPATARHVAQAIGLCDAHQTVISGAQLPPLDELEPARRREVLEACVFARVAPGQKLELVRLHQQAGRVVAMTGDGVNDAPALRQSDIGVAMGLRGTQAAREAAEMVLQDDRLQTIVVAVEQGRVIFGNIRRFVHYLMSCNLSEVLCVALATLAGAPLPLAPLQILFLNLVTDVFPALALGAGPEQPGVMAEPPRPVGEPVVPVPLWRTIALQGLLIAGSVLLALGVALVPLGMSEPQAVTIPFLTLAFAQLWHVLNVRSPHSRILDNEVTRNPWVGWAVLLCLGLVIGVVYLPPTAAVMGLVPPDRLGWTLVIGASLIPLLVCQLALGIGIGTSGSGDRGSSQP